MDQMVFKEDDTLNLPIQTVGKKPPMKERSVKPSAAMKPGIEWDGSDLEVTSEIYSEPITDWDTLLQELGYDPNLYEVIEPVKISSWDSQGEEGVKRLFSYKVNVRAKQQTFYRDDDYKELVNTIKKYKAPKLDGFVGEAVFFVNLADWQLGKADGDGANGTVTRLLDRLELIKARIVELKKMGRPISKIVISGLGDMIEGCDGNYATQVFTVQLNRRQQIRLCRRILTKYVVELSKLADEVDVIAVPGNHGENRKDGKYFTTRGDNDDVAVFEMVAEILSANPEAFGHVKFFLPEEAIYMITEACGRYVGFAHGHVAGGGNDVQSKIRNWWKDQAFTKNDIGFVDLLVTGHYHHFSIVEYDDQTIHMQCPAEDGGSEWWIDLKGQDSRPGTLTFVIDESGKPYRDLEIL